MGLAIYDKGDYLNYPEPFVESRKKMMVIDRKVHFYPSGKWYIRYLYDGLLDLLVEEMHENIKDNLDNVVCIWGGEGSGKSNLAYWLAKKYNPDFDIRESYTYSFDELLTKVHESENDKRMVWWLDEATNVTNNRDWMRRDNKAFIQMLEMFRSRGWTLILCIPDRNRLDVYLREQRIRYILHAQWLDWERAPQTDRGYFELTRVINRNGYRQEQVVGYGEYDRIPDEDGKIYDDIKNETQESKLNELYDSKRSKAERDKMGSVNRKLILRLKEVDGKSTAEIAEITGLSEQTIYNYCTKARKERDQNDD